MSNFEVVYEVEDQIRKINYKMKLRDVIRGRKLRIGLYNVDSKIPNLPLMKISAWHKAQGDEVEWYSPLFHERYDKIYASKIFTFSDKGYLRSDMVVGGSGSDFLYEELPSEIEHHYPDYELFNCKYGIGFITRGCSRKCGFCIVPSKEGQIRYNAPLEEFNREQKKVMLLDNNILAYENHIEELEKLRDSKKKIEFTQGFDIRLITKENAEILLNIKRWKGLRYKFAFDDPGLRKIVYEKLELLANVGFKRGAIQFYVLIGYNTTPKEDLERIEFLKSFKVAIFVMPYNKFDIYQKKFARWVNGYFYKYESFKDYCRGIRT